MKKDVKKKRWWEIRKEECTWNYTNKELEELGEWKEIFSNCGFRKRKGFIYIVKVQNNLYKIGYTTNFKARINAISTHNPYKINPIYKIYSTNVIRLEADFHLFYEDKKVKGEFFKLSEKDLKKGIWKVLDNTKFAFSKFDKSYEIPLIEIVEKINE